MNNNDILIRLRYALDIKDIDMVEIFKLGGIDVTKEDVLKMLSSKGINYNDIDNTEENEGDLECSNIMLESFLNGFIIFRRGKKDLKPGESDKPALSIKNNKSVNNVLLKKLKIALSLSSEDMLNILNEAGVTLTKGELSAVFRKEGQKNYKVCGDRYARNFLKGLAMRYRK
jgi:uncharacterized protein YehS (DUF1456 family)